MAKSKGFTKDDKVWRSMKKNLRGKKAQINLGWFNQFYGAENNFLPMAQVAQWVEEGHKAGGWGGKTPPRPAIRTMFIPALAERGELVKAAIPLVHQVAMGKMTWKTLHAKLAPSVLYKFKYALQSYSYPANAPTTVRLKGFNDPWRETGTLIENARFEIADYKAVHYKKNYTLMVGPPRM